MSTIEERTAAREAELIQRLAEERAALADADVPADEQERAQQAEQMRAAAVQAVDSMSKDDLDKLINSRRLLAGVAQNMQFDEARGELGLADQFTAYAFGRHFRYVADAKRWTRYDDRCGIYIDAEDDAAELAKCTIQYAVDRARRALRLATRAGTPDEVRAANNALAQARKLQRAATIQAILKAASTSPLLRVELRLFDSNRDELVVRNGVIDLRTGQLRPHSPNNYARKSAGAAYDPDAQCPKWEAFLLEVMRGDLDAVRYMQRILGYTLTGHVREEVMFFAYGGGANGKSVMANVQQHLMGDYYVRVSGDFLMTQPQSSREAATPGLVSIAGARLVSVNEVESTAKFSGQQVKMLVSTESISARPLYGKPFDFFPTHKLWVRGNHKPIVHETDHGFWRRMHLIPFLRTFSKEEQNPNLQQELLEELPGILRWAVDGARAWYAEGRLMPAAAVAAATAEYQSDSDLIERWLTESLRRVPDATADAAKVYDDYCKWAEEENIRPMSRPALTRRLADKGITAERRKVNGVLTKLYVGIERPF